MKQRELKVGEVARRTGLTVRTLHHSDEWAWSIPRRSLGPGITRARAAVNSATCRDTVMMTSLAGLAEMAAAILINPLGTSGARHLIKLSRR